MPTEKRKLTKAERFEACAAPAYLRSNGWKLVQPQERHWPGHSPELIKRVDALAAAFCGQGAFDPTHKGPRARKRWARAYDRCRRIWANREWWLKTAPVQFKLIDPETLPPGPEFDGLTYEKGRLCQDRSPEAVWMRKNDDGTWSSTTIPESEVMTYRGHWHPADTDNWRLN